MKEFGEAAPFLRKSELELLTAHTVPFDGKATSRTAAKLHRETTEGVFIEAISSSHSCLIYKEGNKSPVILQFQNSSLSPPFCSSKLGINQQLCYFNLALITASSTDSKVDVSPVNQLCWLFFRSLAASHCREEASLGP